MSPVDIPAPVNAIEIARLDGEIAKLRAELERHRTAYGDALVKIIQLEQQNSMLRARLR